MQYLAPFQGNLDISGFKDSAHLSCCFALVSALAPAVLGYA